MGTVHKLFCGLSWFEEDDTRHQCIVLDSSPEGTMHETHECVCGEKMQ